MTTPTLHGVYQIAVIATAIGLGLLAARHPTRVAISIAATVGAIAATTVLYAGQLVFPLLYFVASRRRGRWIGWSLLIAMLASPPILYWRMPWPRPLPAGPTVSATATVVNLRTVDHVGGGQRTHGQSLRIPFQVVTLTIVPIGSRDTLAATDTVDSGSVAALKKRATVPVIYAPADPGSARLAAASRSYATDLWWYVMEIVYGTTLAVAFVVAILDVASHLLGAGAPRPERKVFAAQ